MIIIIMSTGQIHARYVPESNEQNESVKFIGVHYRALLRSC